MKVLVVGSGGREDALAWRLSRDGSIVAACPGNPGSARWGDNIAAAPEEAAQKFRPDLIVIGPEAPLEQGLADRLRTAGFAVFGPGASGARIESSKAFAKFLMKRRGIPTAHSYEVASLDEGRRALRDWPGERVVIKADGLAAGKGVTVASNHREALLALEEIFVAKRFGAAGRTALIEAFMDGCEASVIALTDGKKVHVLPAAEDHKAVFDHDQGPNTGGMGAISPTPVVTDSVLDRVESDILLPMLDALREEKIDYRGALYAGLMIQGDSVRVVEFNCRFGDPETQVLMHRIEGDFSRTLLSAAQGDLDSSGLSASPKAAACVVVTSGGYPGEFSRGAQIRGWTAARGPEVFISGAESDRAGLVTSGGRVFSVVATGSDLDAALSSAYASVGELSFEGAHFRRDIGRRGLASSCADRAPAPALT